MNMSIIKQQRQTYKTKPMHGKNKNRREATRRQIKTQQQCVWQQWHSSQYGNCEIEQVCSTVE